jgi:FAR-17a/AIG1-like protein
MLYWPIHFYDRTLLVDPTIGSQLPLLDDLGFHFFPAVLLLVDSLFFSPPWEADALAALMSFSVVAGGYWIWVEHCFTRNKFYPYPLLGLLNFQQRLFLFSFATLLCWFCFLVVRMSYRVFNGHAKVQIETIKKEA